MPRRNNRRQTAREKAMPAAVEREVGRQRESLDKIYDKGERPKRRPDHGIGRLIVRDSVTEFEELLGQLKGRPKRKSYFSYAFSDLCKTDPSLSGTVKEFRQLERIIKDSGLEVSTADTTVTLDVLGVTESPIRNGTASKISVKLDDITSEFYQTGFQVTGEQVKILDSFGIPSVYARHIKRFGRGLPAHSIHIAIGSREAGAGPPLDEVLGELTVPSQVTLSPVRLLHPPL